MQHEKQQQFAQIFQKVHQGDEPLILVNVWDVVSAKMVEKSGFTAVATSSAGCAWSLGYKDGEFTPPHEMTEHLKRICKATNLPVSADIEGGYFRHDFDAFSEFINDTIWAGVIGINLEDGYAHTEKLNEISYQVKEIKRAKDAGKANGIDFFVNARTDAMLLSKDIDSKIDICIERAQAFEEAGADGIFIPFIQDIQTVEKLKNKIQLPLNILATSSLSISDLKSLKIDRISVGARPLIALLNTFRTIIGDIQKGDDWSKLFVNDPNYEEINGWF